MAGPRRGCSANRCGSTWRAAATICSWWCRPSRCAPDGSTSFEFRHSGKVIHAAGERVFFVSARGNWYPTHGVEFANYDLTFRMPRDLDLVSAGDVVEDRDRGRVADHAPPHAGAGPHRGVQPGQLRARAEWSAAASRWTCAPTARWRRALQPQGARRPSCRR